MLKKSILPILMALPLVAMSQHPTNWLHIYHVSKNYHTFPVSSIESLTHHDIGSESETLCITTNDEEFSIPISDVDMCEVGVNVPIIRITLTDHPEYTDLIEKEDLLNAVIEIDGVGVFDDVAPTACTIKGRGNSTWLYKKKPYRLKFDTKTSILGFDKTKNYVLLANYIDCTLMRNAIAMKVAQLLGTPGANHIQPVRLYLNGIFKGAYMITEKVGIASNSIDINKNTGILFELDKAYDEDFRFTSPVYQLPVMVKDPDLTEIAVAAETDPEILFEQWKNDFCTFEQKISDGTFVDGIDIDYESFVDFMIVYNLCGNREVTWPKSFYIYKETIESPYRFGPVWDFDWAFTHNNGYDDKAADVPLIGTWYKLLAIPFLRQLCETERFRELYAQRWQYFVDALLPQVYEYMDEYASLVRPSAIENGVVWAPQNGVTIGSYYFDDNVQNLRSWIKARVEYISTHPNSGLYDE